MNEFSTVNVFQSFQDLVKDVNLVHFFQHIGSNKIEWINTQQQNVSQPP